MPTAARPAQPAAQKDRGAPTLLLKKIPKGATNGARQSLEVTVFSMEYEDTCRRTDRLSLTVNNFDGTLFDTKDLARGDQLELTFGYPSNLSPPRRIVIQKAIGGRELQVEALGRGILMHKETRSRPPWFNKKRSDVAREIAQGYGYTQFDIEDTDVVVPSITQARMTDWQFLQRMARAEGFEVFDDFDGFHFRRAQFGQKPIRELRYFTPPQVGEILDYAIENDVTARAGSVNVYGFDPKKKKRIKGLGDNDTAKRDGTGATIDETIESVKTGDTKTTLAIERRPSPASTEDEVKRQAANLYTKAQRVNVKLKLIVVGDPSLVGKSVIKVTGIAAAIDGNYYVEVVSHKIAPGSYTMELHCRTDRGQGTRSKAKQSGGGAADTGALNQQENVNVGNTSTTTSPAPSSSGFNDTRGRGQ